MNLWSDTFPQFRRWEGLLLVVVAVLCVAFQLRVPTTLPTEQDYQAAAAAIEQEAAPGDVVLLAPWWIERARLFVSRVPVVGYFGSDADNLRLHKRVWVLSNPSLPGFSWSHFSEIFGKDRSEDGASRSFGPLVLRRYLNNRAQPVLFSAARSLAQARVYLQRRAGAQPCSFDGRGWRCPNGSEVVEEWRELHFEPHRCLRFYPPGQSDRLVAEFDNVPATELLELVTGYAWERGYYRNADSTNFGLEVNGSVETTTLLPGVERVYRVEKRNNQAGTVRVWVEANNAQNREVCFELTGFGRGTP